MPIDPSAVVASTARVHPDAVIGPRVVIGDFAIVEQDVVIEKGKVTSYRTKLKLSFKYEGEG